MKDSLIFELIAAEIGNRKVSPSLWAMAMKEAMGDDAKAKAWYIRLRAKELKKDQDLKKSNGIPFLLKSSKPRGEYRNLNAIKNKGQHIYEIC